MRPRIYTSRDPAQILIVDDHPLMRRGLADLLALEKDLRVVCQAEHGRQALDYLQQGGADLILLDNNMPVLNGIETLRALREQEFPGKVILFTVSDHVEDVSDALSLGVDGYLLKDMEPSDLILTLYKVLAGEMAISPALAPILARAMRKKSRVQQEDVSLTAREAEVLSLIAEGMSNKMIGNKLGIVESTVKVHVKHLLQKLELRTRVELAVWAVDHARH